jgi:formylglycine-generating enzyme required for sulfatase activity
LPTEAEWEYACRAGTTTAYCSGNGLEALRKVGWCSYDRQWGSAKKTKPVGQFQPNAWGLLDLHGNVFEWCWDWHGPYSKEDIKYPEDGNSGNAWVVRGGCWFFNPDKCRSGSRGRPAPAYRGPDCGCRVVLCLD